MAERRAKLKLEKQISETLDLRDSPVQRKNLADDVIQWCESKLIVPAGPLRGKKFRIPDWQRSFLYDVFNENLREVALSVARKNGKSGLVSIILISYLCGPANYPSWRGLVTSLTGLLAKELYMAMLDTLKISGLLGQIEPRMSPAPGFFLGKNNSRLDFLAADKGTGHAVGGDIALIDEAGLLQENSRALWNAMFSSISGRNGKFIAISIQGDGPMFKEMKQRANDPKVSWHGYYSDLDCDLEDEVQWHKANPGLKDNIKSIEYMRDTSRKCKVIKADESAFRAYDLNLPQDPLVEVICSLRDWKECEKEDVKEGNYCYVGYDIGGATSMTAAAAFFPQTGLIKLLGGFPASPSLVERGKADNVGSLYSDMFRRGELKVYPGRITPVDEFLLDFKKILGNARVILAGADGYRKNEVMTAFEKARIRWPVIWRIGMGARNKVGSDITVFQKAVISKKLKIKPNLMIRSAIGDSCVERDKSGNPVLSKARVKGRIDALVSVVTAVGIGLTEKKRKSGQWAIFQ